jgi:hypothetical protein
MKYLYKSKYLLTSWYFIGILNQDKHDFGLLAG